jgi:hypothetical protein
VINFRRFMGRPQAEVRTLPHPKAAVVHHSKFG